MVRFKIGFHFFDLYYDERKNHIFHVDLFPVKVDLNLLHRVEMRKM